MKYSILKSILFAIVFPLVFSLNSFAEEVPERKFAMEFAGILRNPATSGTGYAGTASSSAMAWSSFDNPAAMSFYKDRFDAGIFYQNWQPEYGKSLNLGTGLAFRTKKGFGLSGGFMMQQGQKMEILDQSGNAKGSFTPKDMQFNLGLGFKAAHLVSIGINLKGFTQELSKDDKSFAFGADLFAMTKVSDFNITLGVANVGTPVKASSGQSFNLPSSVRFGGAYCKTFAETHNIEAVLDADYYFFAGGFSAAAGAQYGWRDMLFARAGYHLGTSNSLLPSFASVGLGAKYFGVRLDVSYILGNEVLKNTLSVGLGYTF